jgi:hypothetical protein
VVIPGPPGLQAEARSWLVRARVRKAEQVHCSCVVHCCVLDEPARVSSNFPLEHSLGPT